MTVMSQNSNDTEQMPIKVKFKASDLPLSSATRAAIEGLAHTFKKKGGYDSLRKQIWDDLMKTSFEANLTESLIKAAEIELEKNEYDLLKKSRSAAQALIHGAVERAGVYLDAEQQIDSLIDLHITEIESGLRTIRKNDIGEELAAAEFARGAKTDEQYAEDARQKREAREKLKNDAKTKELAIIEEKRKEEQKKAEAELEKRTSEREARRKAEREREEKKERDLRDRQRREREKEELQRKERERKEKERDEREKEEFQRKERDRKYQEKKEQENKEQELHDRLQISKNPSCKDIREPVTDPTGNDESNSTKPILSVEEIEILELEALNHLLKPTITRTRHKLDLDIDESLAPPPRKLIPSSAIQPISRDSPLRSDLKKPLKPLKIQQGTKMISSNNKISTRDRRSSRDRSPDRNSTKRIYHSRSRSRSPRRNSKERELKRSKRDSGERSRNERHRNEFHEQDESHRDQHRSRVSKDIEGQYHREQKRKNRSESVESTLAERKRIKTSKTEEREPLTVRKEIHPRGEGRIISPVLNKKSNYTHDKNRERYPPSRSRTPQSRRRVERSLSPPNIDRYVPGAHSRSHRDSKLLRSPVRRKCRSNSRSPDRIKADRYLRDEQKIHRSTHNDSLRQRGRSRDREHVKERSRSRSPYLRREHDKRRERSKSRDRDGYRERDRDRGRDRDRDRERERSRDRYRGHEKKRLRSPSRDRDRRKERNRNRSRSRGSR